MVNRKIKDKSLLKVIKNVIFSFDKNTFIGMPLGNLTSQLSKSSLPMTSSIEIFGNLNLLLLLSINLTRFKF